MVSEPALRVAINGYGRIGRNVLRALYEDQLLGRNNLAIDQTVGRNIEIVAINELGALDSVAHLTRYDSTHGVFQLPVNVDVEASTLQIADHCIQVLSIEDPEQCPWRQLDIDVVLECTGLFRSREDAGKHINAGAKRVVIGAVAFDEVDNTLLYGINHQQFSQQDRIISSASCTTHCLAPVLTVLHEKWGVEYALMTELHAYTSDQHLLDKMHRDLRRARAGAQNLIPTTSSSISAIQQVLPFMQGRIDGYSMRVPTVNVAAVDLTVQLTNAATVTANDITELMSDAANGDFKGILGVCHEPLVSSDFIHRSESAIYDATQTMVLGPMIKLTAWYDNEWGYTHRLLDLLETIRERMD
jgi:glyceraldehyde 3-phosphate dehydrogenase